MVNTIEIENLPEEMGEETAVDNHDDGTITSKLLGSTFGKSMLLAFGGAPKETAPIPAPEVKDEADEPESKPDSEETEETEKKEETEEEEVEEPAVETEEREFDKNPTVLYALVQKKLWKETVERAKSHPQEARAFISRKEKDGRIRWRLLPLHAAIVFKATEEVIETLLIAYPKASEAKDDQGMLPLHLAFRNGASEAVVNSLLLAYPQSVDIPDRKGRVPLTLAKAAESPHREVYIAALDKGPAYYAVTAIACARDRIEAEQKELFDARLAQTRQFHEVALGEVEANAEKKQSEILAKLSEKEDELTKIHENSQVLVDHVASLEAQMNTRSDTERFLATKIAKLEEKVKASEAHSAEREGFWKSAVAESEGNIEKVENLKAESERKFDQEKIIFESEIERLMEVLKETQTKLASTMTNLEKSNNRMNEKSEDWEIERLKLEAKYTKAEVEWANSRANCAILESQLKKRMTNEHSLAAQVSTLAARLSESADSNLQFTQVNRELDEEKMTLTNTITVLEERLRSVASVMESTRKQQMTILDDAIAQEEMMATCMESHAQAVSESVEQEKQMQATKDEMMALIEQSFAQADEKRRKLISFTTDQGKSLSSMNQTRCSMLSCVQIVTANVINALDKDLKLETVALEVQKMGGLPTVLNESTNPALEIRDEAEAIKEEVQTEPSPNSNQEANESVEVDVASPKKVDTFVSDASAVKEVEERRTDMDEKRSEELPLEQDIGRVTTE
mmetsp:Transcript_29312/g.62824  ORF Transcript_29312/g.62824 Transcript_29312/m.62824 type:complete len:743 (+) Transcript_29312:107-2335(+)